MNREWLTELERRALRAAQLADIESGLRPEQYAGWRYWPAECLESGMRALGALEGPMAGGPAMIAALYVETAGVYFDLPGVEPWDETRDARTYAGPWPVVAHPPCQRWGRYWHGGPSVRVRKIRGDDGGCFRAALSAVRLWGGVLEHPEASSAWKTFGLPVPTRGGGWIADLDGGWSCCVEQGHYGHRARKATWLYAFGVRALPSLEWGPSDGARLDEGFYSAEESRARRAAGQVPVERLSRAERLATPLPFRDLLLRIAGSVR